jgi:hypothetical protein
MVQRYDGRGIRPSRYLIFSNMAPFEKSLDTPDLTDPEERVVTSIWVWMYVSRGKCVLLAVYVYPWNTIPTLQIQNLWLSVDRSWLHPVESLFQTLSISPTI